MLLAPRLHRTIACLALLAMLLLSAVPTLGRLAGTQATASPTTLPQAMCTSTGLAMVGVGKAMAMMPGMAMPLALSTLAHGADPEMPAHPADMDCDYCPLLACVVFVAVFVVLLAAIPSGGQPLASRRAAAFVTFAYPCGLGSRGPPLVL